LSVHTNAPADAATLAANPQPGVRIRRPRILEARRHDLATFSVDDEAVIEFGPDLLRFLAMRSGTGPALGEGGAFAWSIPVGAAGTAAYAVVEPTGFDGVNVWTGVTNEVRWKRACREDETLIATCRIADLSRAARLPYRVFSRERRDLVVEGEFVFVSVTHDADGFYVIEPRRRPDAPVTARTSPARDRSAHPPAPLVNPDEPRVSAPWNHLPVWTANVPPLVEAGEPPADDLFVMRPPQVLRTTAAAGTPGAVWEWRFPRDLLRLLGHPIAGASEPLGRRHHPYGRILEGMGIHAALAIAGGRAPNTLSVEWWFPTRGVSDFRIRSTLSGRSAGVARTEHDIYEGESPVGHVRVDVDVDA
jgi:hypothetical protein